MAVIDSEKNANKILNKKVDSGSEIEHFNEIQGQITSLQAEQRNNLNEQRVISGMELQNNQTIAQAAGLLAGSNGGGVQPGVMPINVNQGTNAILNKYGMKPGTVTKTISNTTKSPQKISVTNNTRTTTNIQIAPTPPNIPLSKPNIPMKTGGIKMSSDTERFKVWVNNAFAKQNEAAAIREKEYKKREWSLTKTTNKLIRKMGDIGKTIGKAVSPKNIGNLMNDQLKVVLFLMGFQFVAKNIESILEKVDGFLYWISGGSIGVKPVDGKGGFSFTNTLKSVLGIDKNKSFLDHLREEFSGIVGGIGDLFKARAEAVKSIKFPNIDLTSGLENVLTSVGIYLGDVISAAMTGSKGVDKSIAGEISRDGRKRSMEHYEDKWSHTREAADYLFKGQVHRENTSLGDAVLFADGFKDNFKMAERDYNSFGGLSNNVGSSVKQSKYLGRIFEEAQTGTATVNTSEIVSGLSALSRTARKEKEVYVPEDFLDHLGNYFNIRTFTDRVKIRCKRVKTRYILVKKTMAEMNAENCGEFMNTFAKEYIENKVYATLPAGGVGYLETVAGEWKRGNYGTAVTNAIFGWNGGMRSFISAYGADLRQVGYEDYTIMMVSTEDDRYKNSTLYPSVLDKSGRPLVDENNNTYLALTNDLITLIEKEIARAVNAKKFSFDAEDTESIKIIDSFSDNSGLGNFHSRFSDLDRVKRLELNDAKDVSYNFNLTNPFEKDETHVKGATAFRDEKVKSVVNKLYNRLSSANLGLTSAQISGFIGNVGAESGFDPTAYNKESGASGLCQWLGPRKDRFYGKYQKYPHQATVDEQIDYIIEELNGTESAALEAVKNTQGSSRNSAVAAEAWARHYERPSEKEIESSLAARQTYAAKATETVQEDYEEKGVTDQSVAAAKMGGGNGIMAMWQYYKLHPEHQRIFGEVGSTEEGVSYTYTSDGEKKRISHLYAGYLGQHEYNLVTEVFNNRRRFSDLVMHEEMQEIEGGDSEKMKERLEKFGMFHQEIHSKGMYKVQGSAAAAGLMAKTFASRHKDRAGMSVDEAYTALYNMDIIQLFGEFLFYKYFKTPIGNCGSRDHGPDPKDDGLGYVANTDNVNRILGIPIEGAQAAWSYGRAKAKAAWFLLSTVDTKGVKAANSKIVDKIKGNHSEVDWNNNFSQGYYCLNEPGTAKLNEFYQNLRNSTELIEAYYVRYHHESPPHGISGETGGPIYYSELQKVCEELYSQYETEFKDGKISPDFLAYQILSKKPEGGGASFIEQKVNSIPNMSQEDKKLFLDNMEALYFTSRPAEQASMAEVGRWKTARDLAESRLDEMYLNQLSEYLINRSATEVLGDNIKEEDLYINGNKDEGFNVKTVADVYKEKFKINGFTLEALGDKLNNEYYDPLINFITDSKLERRTDLQGKTKTNLESYAAASGKGVRYVSKLQFERLKNLGRLDPGIVYAIRDSNENTNQNTNTQTFGEVYSVSYDKQNRTDKMYTVKLKNGETVSLNTEQLLSMDKSKLDEEGAALQQEVVKNLGIAYGEIMTGVNASEDENLVDYQTKNYVVNDLRHNTSADSQFKDEYVTVDDPVKGYIQWANKIGLRNEDGSAIGNPYDKDNLNDANPLYDMARAFALKYDIKGGDKDSTETAYQDLLLPGGEMIHNGKKFKISRLEHILVYGARSPWYKIYIEKRQPEFDSNGDPNATQHVGIRNEDAYKYLKKDEKGEYKFGEMGSVSNRYNNYKEAARNLLAGLYTSATIPNGVDSSQKNMQFFQVSDNGELSVLNVKETLKHLSTIKHLDYNDFLNSSGVVSTAQKNKKLLETMQPTDKVLAQALMGTSDMTAMLNNNTIVNGQYLKAMTELLAIIAAKTPVGELNVADTFAPPPETQTTVTE